MDVGEFIAEAKRRRLACGLSQRDVSRMTGLKYGGIERGKVALSEPVITVVRNVLWDESLRTIQKDYSPKRAKKVTPAEPVPMEAKWTGSAKDMDALGHLLKSIGAPKLKVMEVYKIKELMTGRNMAQLPAAVAEVLGISLDGVAE